MSETRWTRRAFLGSLGRAAATAAGCAWLGRSVAQAAQAADRKPGRPPNVVLFLVDDMGWIDSTPYGSRYYETPHIRRLAEQAMRFTDAYAMPLCSPTRASILTGQHSARHGITSATGHQPPLPPGASRYPEKAPPNRRYVYPESRHYLDPKLVTLAEALQGAGYRTGHFGKWHLGLMPQHWPEVQGFETTWHCAPDPGPPSYFSPYGVHAEGKPSGQHKVGNITDGPKGEYIADRLTDEAIRFIQAHRDEPFYLNLWHYSVHGPWQHKEAYTAEFAEKRDPRGKQRNPVMASMLRSVDESLGRILDTLDRLGLAEDTLFIFYSDNGGNVHSWREGDRKLSSVKPGHRLYETVQSYRKWAGGEPPTNNAPLREGKGRIYEGGVRVPLMIRWPGRIEPGATSDAVVGPIDVYPTVLEALGLTKPDGHIIDGVSLMPVLRGTGNLEREAFFIWFPHLIPAVSVRQGDWKLIHRFEPHPDYPDVRELYNLKDDIGETTNLANEMPEKVKHLDALIDRFVQETGAAVPKPNPAYTPTVRDWRGRGDCTLEVRDGVLVMESAKERVSMQTASVPKAEGPLVLTLRLRTRQAGRLGIAYWSSVETPGFAPERRCDFTPKTDGQWHDYTVTFEPAGALAGLRLDPSVAPGRIDVERITLARPDGAVLKTWTFDG